MNISEYILNYILNYFILSSKIQNKKKGYGFHFWLNRWHGKNPDGFIKLTLTYCSQTTYIGPDYCSQFDWSMLLVLLMTKQLIVKGCPMFHTKEKMWWHNRTKWFCIDPPDSPLNLPWHICFTNELVHSIFMQPILTRFCFGWAKAIKYMTKAWGHSCFGL